MYDLGETVPLGVDVKDSAGVLTNAQTISLAITLPDGILVNPAPTVTNPPTPTGKYQYDYVTTQFGLHRYRFNTTNPVAAYADAFNVVDQAWPAFVGLAEVKAHLNIEATNTTHDEELRGFILSASEVVEDVVGVVARRTFVETYCGRGDRAILLKRRPVISVTSVTENGATVDPANYSVTPAGVLTRATAYSAGCWSWGVDNITVTYVAGRTAAPWSVVDATKELIRVNWRPQQGGNYSPFDQGGTDNFGTPTVGEVRLGFYVPNTVMQRLTPSARGPHIA